MTTRFTMVNPGIHPLLQPSIDRLIQIGSGMAQTPRKSRADRAASILWRYAMEDFIAATNQLIEFRQQDKENAA